MSTKFSRRDFIRNSGAATAGFLASAAFRNREQPARPPDGDRILITGAIVVTMDNELGNYESADILIEEGHISEISEQIEQQAGMDVVDASGQIIMPGFVDTHRHMWQGALRNILPNGRLSDYMRVVTGEGRAVFRPQDARIGNLITALSAIDSGITTVLDWSHIGNSPAHTDAAIRGLRESGIRGVYAYGTGSDTPENRFPNDLGRIQDEFFSDDDSLITLALGAGINRGQWELAREHDVRISVHVNGTGDLLPLSDVIGPDLTCIHCCNLLDEEWQLLADRGAGVSISSPVEMIMGHGIPPIQQTLDYGIAPSLSVDVETTVPSNMFTQMRSVYTLQRMQVLARERNGEDNLPDLLTADEMLTFATINGARHNGLDDITGSLTPGKKADLIMLSADSINIAPLNNVFGAIVMGMDRANVEMVMIDGSIKKWQGKLMHDGIEEVFKEAEESREFIYSEADWNRSEMLFKS
ncbi:amidohydrolase [Rhodohalobacter sp. SW132]|uniref:amidohydrolase family protein n=1 Tax=Rhodohalobacter sp. SW132 TaxID=2293433 RepID=UPI000E283A79|nr:amidohydrolase family protein [Rhodohalobacter sp. SW132]REL37840.1 amidohydrolase [Rhodohalobacter sp. SW132]